VSYNRTSTKNISLIFFSTRLFKIQNMTEDCCEDTCETTHEVKVLRVLIKSYVDEQQYASALYWADKLVTLTNSNEDIYSMCKCLILCKHYHRVTSYISSRKLQTQHLGCCYILAKAFKLLNNEQAALEILLDDETEKLLEQSKSKANENCDMKLKSLISGVYCLKAAILESIDNRDQASEAYQTALNVDIYCFKAFEALKDHQMLTAIEERNLINSLSSSDGKSLAMVKSLFLMDLKKYDSPGHTDIPPQLSRFEKNNDIRVSMAERLYYNCDHVTAFEITSDIMRDDPLHHKCVPLHIALLVDMKETNELFQLAHTLVEHYPEWSIAWYGVGCYYFSTGKQDNARKYLEKATQLDRLFGPAWLAYGHSFAQEKEHDQAMAAYLKASQLMQGCHLPLLYIGLEHSLTNNQNFAEKFFKQALSIAPHDPFVLHELGVTAFNNQDYDTAEKYFTCALKKIKNINETARDVANGLADKWEALLNNLGHTYRKQGRYSEALSYFKQALVLSPLNPTTYSSIGFVMSLTNDLSSAVDYFHRALGLRREDAFSTNMLNEVIERLMTGIEPFPDYPDKIPRFGPLCGVTSASSTANDLNLHTSSDIGGNDSSLQGNFSTSEMNAGLLTPINTDSQQTLGDASNLSIDCEMEDVSRTLRRLTTYTRR